MRRSALTPAPRPVTDSTIGAHHSDGMLSRCHHFETAEADARISDAIASRDCQSAITSRNEAMLTNGGVEVSVTPEYLGQLVLTGKANLSHDCGRSHGEGSGMVDRMSETEEKLAFIGRTKQAREARFPTQKPILVILGLDQGTYKQYEVRTPLPHRYIPKFCAACGVDIEWLLTGEGKGPVLFDPPRLVSSAERRPRGRKKRQAA